MMLLHQPGCRCRRCRQHTAVPFAGDLASAGATVLLLHSTVLPDPLLVVANAKLADALVAALREAGVL